MGGIPTLWSVTSSRSWVLGGGLCWREMTGMAQRLLREIAFFVRGHLVWATGLTWWGWGSVHSPVARADRMRTGGYIAPAGA